MGSYYSTTATSTTWNNWTTATISYDNSTSGTWSYWNGNGNTTITSTSSASSDSSYDTTWYHWNVYESEPIKLTKEQTDEYNRNVESQRIAAEVVRLEQEAKEKAKTEKARQLLREVLTDEQDQQLDEKGYFELTSVKSGNIYRIHKGRTKNVELLNKDGKTMKRLCFHPAEYLHNYDTLAIQKLMLENDEEDVKKVANYS